MKDILSRLQLKRERTDKSAASSQYWRLVPKIDLLSKSQESRYSSKVLVYAGLAILIILVAYICLLSFVSLRNLKAKTDNANSEYATIQGAVTAKQNDISKLQTQINQLKQQQTSSQQVYTAVQGLRLNWDKALPAIFSSEINGITFQGVTSASSNEIDIQGIASDQAAIASLQSELVKMSSTLQLQGISFALKNGIYQFDAQVLLKQE